MSALRIYYIRCKELGEGPALLQYQNIYGTMNNILMISSKNKLLIVNYFFPNLQSTTITILFGQFPTFIYIYLLLYLPY